MDDEMLRAIARLAVSLPLVAALAYFAIKYGLGRRSVGMYRRRYMRVVEQLPLGPKVLLSLVQVGDKYYLLAHQDGSTILLAEMDEMPAEIMFESRSTAPGNILSAISEKWLQRENKGHEK